MDNYIVSARKYRPGNFRSVVGQNSLTTTLKNAIVNNKLAHAYLFCGPRGVGKTTCARIFAKSINCLNPKPDGEPCNECESCSSFNESRSYNIHELDAASNNSVEDIRSLTEQVRIPPQLGKYKVYIIDEVHMLSAQAFNAFLKTLEEPPHYAIFILATTEKHKIIPTILSRCQIYDFNRIGNNDIVDYLAYVAGEENVPAEREALSVIAQKADGGMRDALSIFDQIVSFSQGNITYKSVIDNLNVLDYEYYFSLTDAILQGDVPQALLLFDEVLNKGFDGQRFVSGLADFFRDLLVCKDPRTAGLFEVSDAAREKYSQYAAKCSNPMLYKALDLTVECDLNYKASKNKRLMVELLLIRLCQLNTNPQGEEDKKKTAIEPITPAKPEPPEPVKAAPPTPQPRAEAKPASTPAPAPPPPAEKAAAPKIKKEAPLSFSIKDSLKREEAKAEEKVTVEVENMNEAFDETTLIRRWKDYAERQEDIHLKNTMLNILPVLKEDYTIEIEAPNQDRAEKLKEIQPELYQYLAGELRNSHIKLEVRVNANPADKRPVLPQEKYQFMLAKNPALQTLAQELDLRLD